MANTRAVTTLGQELRRVHRDLRHARNQSEQEVEGLLRSWVDENEDLLGHGAYLDDDLIDAAKAFLLTGDGDEETLGPNLLTAVRAGRVAIADDLRGALARSAPAARAVIAPHAAFVSAVKQWLGEARAEGDISDWATILDTWRSALSLTTREAAVALEVSPSAIVRYSGGSRTPSVPQVVAMVEAMSSWDPATEDTKMRVHARGMAMMFERDPDEATNILEDIGSERTRLEGTVEDGLDALSIRQLGVIAALVASPSLLDWLAALASDDLFSEIQTAAAAVRGVPARAAG